MAKEDALFLFLQILDTGGWNHTAFGMLFYESAESICAISESVAIKRTTNDQSNLEVNVEGPNITNGFKYKNGHNISITASASHLLYGPNRSVADAYNAQLFVYYDAQQLLLTKYETVKRNVRSLSASQVVNSTGKVHFQTDWLPYLTNQAFKVCFEVAISKYIGKAASLKGSIIVEYIFSTNKKEFNGYSKLKTREIISYECKVGEDIKVTTTNERLSVPYFSALYNDVTDDIFFCVKKEKFLQRNTPRCYWNKNGSFMWTRIPFIAALVAVDKLDSTLYGIDPRGNGYVKLNKDYAKFTIVEDVVWTSIENEPRVHKAQTSFSLTGLPSAQSGRWVFYKGAEMKWAVTQRGVWQNTETGWERRVQF